MVWGEYILENVQQLYRLVFWINIGNMYCISNEYFIDDILLVDFCYIYQIIFDYI